MFWQKKKTIGLPSGVLRFRVKVDDKEHEWLADLITLKIAAEQLEQLHNLEKRDNQLHATPEFLGALSDRYCELGCPACDPTQARAVWVAVNRQFWSIEEQLENELLKL